MNEWTPQQVATAIDILKMCLTKEAYLGAAARVATMQGRTDGDAVQRKVWAVVLRADEYDLEHCFLRVLATAPTYGLLRLVGMSHHTTSKEIIEKRGDKLPDAKYLSLTLAAPINIIEAALRQTDPKQGIQGFGL